MIMYRAFNKEGQLLLIGSSTDLPLLMRRLSNKPWFGEVARVELQRNATKNVMEKAIYRERPKYHPSWINSEAN